MSIINDAELFVGTLQNDKYLYEDALKLGLVKPMAFYGIPYRLNNLLSNSVVRYAFIALYPILFLFLLLYSFIRSVFKHSKCVQLNSGSYFIAATNFSKSINNRVNKHIGDACWILNDGVEVRNYNITSGKYVKCFELVSFIDLVSAACSSLLVLFLICRKYGAFYITNSLNAYKWLVYWHACRRVPEEAAIFFVNHKDRWAFLEDHIHCKSKTLIQHGSEIGNCSDSVAVARGMIRVPGGWTQDVPYKYRTLKQVIALSDSEVEALKRSLIDCNTEFIDGGYGFETYDLKSDRYSVLIIAHSGIYIEKELQIIEEMQKLPIDIYIKNHPTQRNDAYTCVAERENIILITEQRFPHVNLAVAYDSTLAHEYQSVGIPVIYHTKSSVDEIIELVKKYI